jgi:hypothetical protein
MDEREPDIRDDPRGQDTGQGYPEEQEAGASPVEGTERGPEAGACGPERAPDTEGGQDESPGGATGNPGAAGG